MDDASDTLGMNLGPAEPGAGSWTGMETTAEADSDDDRRRSRRPVDLSFLAPSPRAGSLGRLGDYEILGVLGRGAMGVVLKGHDRALHRLVAVKVQDPTLATNGQARARFLREARAVAAIRDPHVVIIYKVHVVRERPYLVMEYVETSLRERIRAGPPLGLIEALRIGSQVARGLAAAHAVGVLHRDVKPANILLEEGGRVVKLTDFGLAVAGCDGVPVASAEPNRMAGTPGYMSPEQVRGQRLDARSDLFGLGCVLHALFARHSPFAREDPDEILRAVCDGDPAPTPVPPGCAVGAKLADLIARLLARRPEDRPASARQVASVLEILLAQAEAEAEARSGDPGEGPPAPAGAESRPEPATEPEPGPESTSSAPPGATPLPPSEPRPGVPRVMLAGATLGAVSLIGLSLVAWLPGPSAPPPRTTWTVGRTARADFPDLASALERVRPGLRLLLIDEGAYEGPFLLDDANKFRDLTIESAGGAVLTAEEGPAVVAIRGVPGVTLHNLTIRPRADQFAAEITGACPGTTLSAIRAVSPRESRWTQVYLHDRARGEAGRPIRVLGSRFAVAHGGVTIEGTAGRPVEHVEVLGNRFEGRDEQVHVLQSVRYVTVSGNVFVGGQAVTINLVRHGGRGVTVANNSFFRSGVWLHPADSHPEQDGVTIRNNAILETSELDVGGRTLKMARAQGGWSFRNNLWEPGPRPSTPGEGDGLLAQGQSRLEVLSRDPERPEFLRPTPGSALASQGAVGALPGYVGALAPAVEPTTEPGLAP